MATEITYELAVAAGRDAGNRLMRAGGRTVWAVKDWNTACETFARLWPEPTISNQTAKENDDDIQRSKEAVS
jgi:hypothetical protein